MKYFLLFQFLILFFTSSYSYAKTYKVEMLNRDENESMVFKPAYLKVDVSDTVIFVPTSKGHNSESIFTPKDGESWKGEANKEVSITFKKEGVYIYNCKNHFIMGMSGVIQVGEAKNIEEAKDFIKEYKKKVVMKKDRIDKYFKNVK